MRPRKLAAMIAAMTLTLAACSDTNGPTRVRPSPATMPATALTPTQLDELAQTLIDVLFPNGLETAAGTRWENVKRKLAEGQREVAESMYLELVRWIQAKQVTMDPPPNGESRDHAVARLIAAMSTYLYGGDSPVDLGSLEGDVVVGIGMPDQPLELVTPTKNAGMEADAGTFEVPTVVIVAENRSSGFSALCSGPLDTQLCQYPMFYKFEPYPYRRLLKPARFGVCHANLGDYAPPRIIDARIRLAHTKPADPANFTPGAIRPEGENIEILPFVEIDFLDCESTVYVPPIPPIGDANGGWMDRGVAVLGNVLQSAAALLTPKSAHAIDLGGGGEAVAFSDFNILDPLRSGLIDFETLPGGLSLPEACASLCSITTQYANAGVTFDFIRSIDGAALGYVTLLRGGPNPSGDVNNHEIVSAQVLEGSGFWTGTLVMRFVNPTSITYLLRGNASLDPITINAYGPDGKALPVDQITRTKTLVFPADCVECVRYFQQTITVTNATGISRIEMPEPRGNVVVDDLVIGPPAAPPGEG